YGTEKLLKEYGNKVGEESRKKIEAAVEKVKSVINAENVQTIKMAIEELNEASHAIAAEMYKQTGSQAGPGQAETDGAGPGAGAAGAEGGPAQGSKDGAGDADFEVVDDDEKK
ncbi:MAG: molecular chaperone DnaK, partial [candidate division Zixibacteria bacterium]|nr:molecular chaperone DnaK [candidate division Zixibacteria bacterium]